MFFVSNHAWGDPGVFFVEMGVPVLVLLHSCLWVGRFFF